MDDYTNNAVSLLRLLLWEMIALPVGFTWLIVIFHGSIGRRAVQRSVLGPGESEMPHADANRHRVAA